MKIIEKLKNAIFEEDEFEELENKEEFEEIVPKKDKKIKKEKRLEKIELDEIAPKEEIKIPEIEEEPVEKVQKELVKKIDIEKTIPKRRDLFETEIEPTMELPKREHRKTPVIFDESDLITEDEVKEEPKKEVARKTLYGGYREEKPKEKFKPSPVLSPVYGFVGVSPVLEQPRKEELSSYSEIYEQEKKEEVTVEEVRQKAFGIENNTKEDDDLGLLYDMKEEEKPSVSKITIGDAEEYFDDLGLEYNVDYKDTAKENELKSKIEKAKEESLDETLTEDLEEISINDLDLGEDIKENTQELEITKEQLKPKTAKEIKKVKKIKDADLEDEKEEEPEEKNLYDLIDMMYESKE